MNQWLLDHCTATQPPPRLERVCSSRAVSIVLAHDPGKNQPLWICKRSSDPDGIARLEIEGRALVYLKPWARELGIPEVLEWDQGIEEACLVRSVVPGENYPVRPLLSASGTELEAAFRRPLDWLKRFRRQVPPPLPQRIGELTQALCDRLEESGQPALRALKSFLVQDPAGVADRPAFTIHGDFFPPNIMLGVDGKLRVVDWDHFGTGNPFRDELNLLVGSNFVNHLGRAWNVDEIWRAMMFSASPISSFIHREMNVSAEEARFYHYCYVAWQAVDGAPVERHNWLRTLERLANCGFPGPGSDPAHLAPEMG